MIGRVWAAGISFLLIPVYLRLLGTEAFALVGLFAALSSFVAILDAGFSTTLNRSLARAQAGDWTAKRDAWSLLRSMEWIFGLLSLATVIVIAATSPLIVRHWLSFRYLDPALIELAIIVMAIAIGIQFFSSIYSAALTGLHMQLELNAIQVTMTTLRGLGAIAVMMLVSKSLVVFYVWQALCSALQLIIMMIIVYRIRGKPTYRIGFSRDVLRQEAHFITGMAGSHIIGVMILYSDKLVLSWMIPLAQLAYYNIASSAAIVVQILATSLFGAIFPKLSALQEAGDHDRIGALYIRMTQLVAIGATPIVVTLIAFPSGFLMAWTNDAAVTTAARMPLVLLMIAALLNIIAVPSYAVQLAKGRSDFAFKATLIQGAMFFAGLFVFAPRFGGPGAAAAQVTGHVALLGITLWLTHRQLLRRSFGKWLGALIPPMAAAGATALLLRIMIVFPADRILAVLSIARCARVERPTETTRDMNGRRG
jgi:O-antigen/teichoic acid export membrane protein